MDIARIARSEWRERVGWALEVRIARNGNGIIRLIFLLGNAAIVGYARSERARVAGGADAGTALAVGAAVAAATAEVVGPPPAVTPAVLAAARERVAWVRGRVEERWESGRH